MCFPTTPPAVHGPTETTKTSPPRDPLATRTSLTTIRFGSQHLSEVGLSFWKPLPHVVVLSLTIGGLDQEIFENSDHYLAIRSAHFFFSWQQGIVHMIGTQVLVITMVSVRYGWWFGWWRLRSYCITGSRLIRLTNIDRSSTPLFVAPFLIQLRGSLAFARHF